MNFVNPKFGPRVMLLSLELAAERRSLSIEQLRAEKINFEIVDAVDGIESAQRLKTEAGGLSPGELGCYYTHCRAYRHLLDYGWPHALILEDDFRLLSRGRLTSILEELPTNCDYLSLHGLFPDLSSNQVLERFGKLNRMRPCTPCTPGYVISAGLSMHILTAHAKPCVPIDLLLCGISYDLAFGFYELADPLVGVTGAPSLIGDDRGGK